MAKSYPLEIVTLKRTVFSDEAECVTVPGGLGYLGILAGHAPLLTNVEIGALSIRLDGGYIRMGTYGGAGGPFPETSGQFWESEEA